MKIRDWLTKIKIGIAVGRVAAGGKGGKIFDRIEQGSDIADKSKEISDLVKQMLKKSK